MELSDGVDHLPFLSSVASTFTSPMESAKNSCVVEGCMTMSSAFTCPHCQHHYCSKHAGTLSMLAKLTDGAFDPISGQYQRICVYCYWEKRPGYDYTADDIVWSEHIEQFIVHRTVANEELQIKINRIDRKLQKLCEYNQFEEGIGKISFKEYCQRTIPWKSDDQVLSCPICKDTFSVLNRKHHCRLCGEIICKSCSCSIPIKLFNEETAHSTSVETRICTDCKHLLFKYLIMLTMCRKKSLMHTNKYLLSLFSKYISVKSTIQGLLPRYEYLLSILEESKDNHQMTEDKIAEYLDEATACRDSLTLQFVHFQATAKLVSECDEHLSKGILIAAQSYLKKHMYSLQLLPKFKDIINSRKQGGESIPNADDGFDPPLLTQSHSDEPIVANITALQDKMNVLLIQQDQLRDFLNKAMQEGKAEEAALLQRALGECKEEIKRLKTVLT